MNERLINRKSSTQLIVDVLQSEDSNFNYKSIEQWKRKRGFIEAIKFHIKEVLKNRKLAPTLEAYDSLKPEVQYEIRDELAKRLNLEKIQTKIPLSHVVATVESVSALSYREFSESVKKILLTFGITKTQIYYATQNILRTYKMINQNVSIKNIQSKVSLILNELGVTLPESVYVKWFELFTEINTPLLEHYGDLLEFSTYYEDARGLQNPNKRPDVLENVMISGERYKAKPVFLEHDIKSQSSEVNRSLIEVISNSLDASKTGTIEVKISENGYVISDSGEGMSPYILIEKLLPPKISGKEGFETIGRFGVGFYTTLSHIKNPGDFVKVVTNNGEESYELLYEIPSIGGEIVLSTRRLQSNGKLGTSIEIQSESFNKEDAERIVKETFAFAEKMPVILNNEQVNGGKLEELGFANNKLKFSENLEDSGNIYLLIGDALVEKIEINQKNIPRNLVLKFSLLCKVPESRSELSIDSQSVSELENIIKLVNEVEDDEMCVSIANTFAELLKILRPRFAPSDFSRLREILQMTVKERFLRKGYTPVPNFEGFYNLKIQKPVYLHEDILGKIVPEKIEGVKKVEQWTGVDGYELYVADFSNPEEWIFEHDKYIFIDRKIFEKWKSNLAPLETWMKDLDRTGSRKDKKARGSFLVTPREVVEKSELAREMGKSFDFFIDASFERSQASHTMKKDNYIEFMILPYEEQLNIARKQTRLSWVDHFISMYGPMGKDKRKEYGWGREEEKISQKEQDDFIEYVDQVLSSDNWRDWYKKISSAVPKQIGGSMGECTEWKMMEDVERMRRVREHEDMIINCDLGYNPLMTLESLQENIDLKRLKTDLNYDWSTIKNAVTFLETLSRGVWWMESYEEGNAQSRKKEIMQRGYALFMKHIANLSVVEQERAILGFSHDEVKKAYKGEYEKVPKHLRAYIVYMFEGGDLLQPWQNNQIELTDKAVSIPLSQLVSCKRSDESLFSGLQTTTNLVNFVEVCSKGNDPSKAMREIQHAVQNQIVNDNFLWVREMIQNSLDAIRISKRSFKEIPKIEVSPYYTRNNLVVEVSDPIGMNFATVVNYLLVPGESTKRTDDRTIGAFGQGFFTILNGANKVLIKTSIGDGYVTNIELTPVFDSSGNLLDYNARLDQIKENFAGTKIQQFKYSELPEMEAAFCKSSVFGGGSLINAKEVGVVFSEKKINKERDSLSEIEVPNYGKVAIYAGNENVVTQQGLFIKNIDEEYLGDLPDAIRQELEKTGMVIDLPKKVELIRSRADIARKQDVLPVLKPFINQSLIMAFLKGFGLGQYESRGIPYDFFDPKVYFPFPSDRVLEDAKKINENAQIDVNYYIENQNELTQLLLEIPHINYGDSKISLREMRELFMKDPKNFDISFLGDSRGLRDLLNKSKHEVVMREANEKSAEVRRQELGLLGNNSTLVMNDTPLPKNKKIDEIAPALYALDLIIKGIMNKIEIDNIPPTYYYEVGQSDAHASRSGNVLGFNLDTFFRRNQPVLLKIIERKLGTDDPLFRGFLSELVDTITHEKRHMVEGSGAMSHDEFFFKGQRAILSDLIKNGLNLGKVIKQIHALKSTEIKPEDLIKLMS